MNWGQSYSASWSIYKVNKNTWADAESVSNIDSASVTRTTSGNLLESGSFEATGDVDTGYYRIVMTAEQGNDVERVDVATLLLDVKSGTYNYGTTVHSVEGYSVLYPASTKSVVTGEYAPAGANGAQYAADLLESAINAPVNVTGSFFLQEHIVHDVGSSVLDAAWAVLDAGGFVIQIDGRGEVNIVPKPTTPSLILDSTNTNLITNGINYTNDISKIPNRYIVIVDNQITTAANNDPNSEVSTATRGYCVDLVDESPTPVNGETKAAYALRRLHEESIMKDERSYTREYYPDVYLYSIVSASITGLTGNLTVTAQTVNCGNGITIDETAVREVDLWQTV